MLRYQRDISLIRTAALVLASYKLIPLHPWVLSSSSSPPSSSPLSSTTCSSPREGQVVAELRSLRVLRAGPFSATSPSSDPNPTTPSTPFPKSTAPSSASVAAQFLRTHDVNFSNRPPNSGAEHIAYNYQDLVFAPYGSRWRARRKLLNLHLFSGKALDNLRPVRAGELALLVRSLRDQAVRHGLVNLGRATYVCATNALSRATVGRRVFGEVEREEEAAEFKDMVVQLMRLAGAFNMGDFVPGIGWLDLQGVVRQMKELHRRYDGFFDGFIAECWGENRHCVNDHAEG